MRVGTTSDSGARAKDTALCCRVVVIGPYCPPVLLYHMTEQYIVRCVTEDVEKEEGLAALADYSVELMVVPSCCTVVLDCTDSTDGNTAM